MSIYFVCGFWFVFRDILLLETGFLCILLAPFNWLRVSRRTAYHPHDNIVLWLVKWLLFRLMFASGVVKLTSGCPTWWGLTGEPAVMYTCTLYFQSHHNKHVHVHKQVTVLLYTHG